MNQKALERECSVYTRYFIRREPTSYIARKYLHYHDLFTHPVPTSGRLLDNVLLALSRQGTLATRLADVYASRFAKTATLRRKLSLVLALLESSSLAPMLEAAESRAPFQVCVRIAVGVVLYVTALAIAAAGLIPVHLLSAIQASRSRT